MPAPPMSVLNAFLAPTSYLERRIEIHEFDGKTPWRPNTWDTLVDGSVSVDYTRDDRRNLDLTLDNQDGVLDHSPTGLWYDKVFKIFYGIHVAEAPRTPAIVIVEEYNAAGQAVALKNALNSVGFTRVRVNVDATTLSQIQSYDIIVSISTDYNRKLTLLQEAFNAGKSVLCLSLTPTASQLPYLIGTAAAGTVTGTNTVVAPTSTAHPVQTGWSSFTVAASVTYRAVTAVVSGATAVINRTDANGTNIAGIVREQVAGARWGWLQRSDFLLSGESDTVKAQLTQLLGSMMRWLDVYVPVTYWETQIGEFVPEQISVDSGDPDLIRITARDYSKRCLESKLVTATTYAAGTSIDTLIKNQASNAYCFKTSLPPTGKTLTKDITYESSTERWKIMKEVADTNGYELFFTAQGYLTMRPYQDPLLTPATLVLSSGEAGNLVSKSTTASDARLRNHIIVKGESSDSTVLPVWGEARNDNTNSPSRINKIGDRVDEISSPLYTTTLQCQNQAKAILRVSSLEEFTMDFEAIMFPWLEVGEILEMGASEQPSGVGEPQRYLLTSLSIALDLGPMSGNAKRVTIVV